MTTRKYEYLFGPVPSRRLGRSLGVDLTPYKTCSFNCVFCQLGRTTHFTVERREYVPTDAVLAEIVDWIRHHGEADYFTLSGSGEPTLHAQFGDILTFIREHTDIPAAVLTNGSLLHLPEVRRAASHAQIVKVSLSAWDRDSYRRINRPHPSLSFRQLVRGQRAFREEYDGKLWMEVFLLKEMNDSVEQIKAIASVAREIAPDRIQLNTCVRPPADTRSVPLTEAEMKAACELFEPEAQVIADFEVKRSSRTEADRETILAMLQRRPCRAEDIAKSFDMHINEVSKYLGSLMSDRQIEVEQRNGEAYYKATMGKGETA